ncbi:uncharacterized protein LOC124996183 [Mugil cephalus]|uniref:uncharacterized protein LOC124996183 n=1 Tax=Mugil cephalus TaxID=48193 RepID=UPI001FB6ACD9|nr:uncharacterized protein LOC124996183 [Mugil cephalus]
MADEAAPHISLALHPEHEAKELGSIVKRSLQQTDWAQTSVPQVQYSASTKMYCIQITATDTATLTHAQISRHHGRERTDHPDTSAMLSTLPDTLWSTDPTDVGLIKCEPVTFELQYDYPIWLRQYPHKQQAEDGIQDTIDGLLQKGVLEPSQSSWITGTELCTNGILYQRKGGERVIMTYVSVMLDAMEKRHPACTQHVAGVAKLIQKTAHIVMEHQLNVLTTHSVVAYVNSHTFTLTALRQRRLSKILEAPNLTFTHEGINMAEQMSNGEPHQCTERVHRDEKVRPDLLSEPIKGGRDLYTDGCCYQHDKDGLVSAYAVVEQTETGTHTVRAERIQGQQSAQRAEVLAVIAALEEGKDQIVNIYCTLTLHMQPGQYT